MQLLWWGAFYSTTVAFALALNSYVSCLWQCFLWNVVDESCNSQEALPVNDGGAGLVVLLLGDPHGLEGWEGRQDGATNPGGVLPPWWSDDVDLYSVGGEGSELFLQSVSKARKHGGTTGQDDVGVEFISEFKITHHDGVIEGLVDAISGKAEQFRLPESLRAPEPQRWKGSKEGGDCKLTLDYRRRQSQLWSWRSRCPKPESGLCHTSCHGRSCDCWGQTLQQFITFLHPTMFQFLLSRTSGLECFYFLFLKSKNEAPSFLHQKCPGPTTICVRAKWGLPSEIRKDKLHCSQRFYQKQVIGACTAFSSTDQYCWDLNDVTLVDEDTNPLLKAHFSRNW